MSHQGTKKIVGIVQPTYLPWLPFFERMAISDCFVCLDDVEYSKNSFFNRNWIKGAKGRQLLTVPVLYTGHSRALINEIEVDVGRNWNRKHWETIRHCYARAPYFDRYRKQLEEFYMAPGLKLVDAIMPVIRFMRDELGIRTPFHLSSETRVQGVRNEKLVNLCKHFGGTHFVVKPGSEAYHPREEFEPFGIHFEFIEYTKVEYPQLHGAFEPHLSALDYLLNCGPGEFAERLNRNRQSGGK